MGRTYYYDVYDREGLVMEHVSTIEIQEHFQTSFYSMTPYTRKKGKKRYLGKYLVVPHGEEKPDIPPENEKAVKCNMPERWKEEWREVCRRLSRDGG